MSFGPPTQPPAGWYPDPYRPGTNRWWNGRDWEARWDAEDGVDDLPEVGTWLSRSFSLGFGRWRAAAAVAALTSSLGGVLMSLAFAHLTEGVVIFDDEVVGWKSERLPLGIVLAAAAILISALGTLAITVLMLRTVDGERPGDSLSRETSAAWSAIRHSLTILPRAIVWTVLPALAILVVIVALAGITVAVAPLGVILVLAAIPAMVFLALRLAFLSQSIVDRPGQPYTRSFEVSRGRWWAIFGRILLLGILVWLLSIVLQTVGGLVAGTGAPGFSQRGIETRGDGTFVAFDLGEAFEATPWALAINYLVGTVISVIGGTVGGVGFALLYRTRNPVESEPFAGRDARAF